MIRARRAVLFLLLPVAVRADQTVQVGPDLSFSPATVTIVPGETVTWEFQAPHTSTSDAQSGPEIWNSGLLSSGTFSHTFQTPGSYPYYCALHSFPGGTAMNGVVQVSGTGVSPTPTVTVTPTGPPPTATPRPTVTTPVPGGPPSGVPDLGILARALLGAALAAAGTLALLLSRRT
jgi:plastocyanin